MSGLTIAVPRGALFGGTLDLLDTLGVDTAEVRSNDRKLLFAEAGIVTMRPSDVPTYVEHGSADVGVTGKDVLLEQSHRNVYELVDLGFGRCRMVVAARDGVVEGTVTSAAPLRPDDERQLRAVRQLERVLLGHAADQIDVGEERVVGR